MQNSMRMSRRDEEKLGTSSTPKIEPISTSHLLAPSEVNQGQGEQ